MALGASMIARGSQLLQRELGGCVYESFGMLGVIITDRNVRAEGRNYCISSVRLVLSHAASFVSSRDSCRIPHLTVFPYRFSSFRTHIKQSLEVLKQNISVWPLQKRNPLTPSRPAPDTRRASRFDESD